MRITPESPLTEDGRALVAGSQRALEEVYPPEEIFSFTADELAVPGTTFYVARADKVALGCVASCDCGAYVEVKRLFVPGAGRGKGVARALMARLETDARASGKQSVKLETGDALKAATALYRSLGYNVR